MKSLDVLQRLAKQAVDRERQALQAINAEIAAIEGDIDEAQRAIEREADASPDFMTSGTTLAAFIAAQNKRMQDLRDRLRQLEHAHGLQIERLQHERSEQKRYERLAERRAREAALEAEAKEQKAIDELVTMNHKPP
ncbi:MAG: flagellar FliJ family protein [Alphaproteobacteria bacterium]|nr:flagellar FliJ family protein [Alphaproteobacteria bacterium]